MICFWGLQINSDDLIFFIGMHIFLSTYKSICTYVKILYEVITKKRRKILRLFYYLSWLTYKKRLMLFLGVFSNSLG